MAEKLYEEWLAEIAEGDAQDPEVECWIAEHPEAAAEIELARRVHLLVTGLRAAEFEVPGGFEERLLARVHQDTAVRNLIDFGLNGVGALLLELIGLILGLLPKAPAQAAI